MSNIGLREQAEAWRKADPDPSTAEELGRVLAENNAADLADRFAGNLEFGTAGLRGVLGAGPNRMNRAVVRRTSAGLARYLKAQVPEAVSRGVVIGRDGRRMSAEFAEDTACVLAAEGIPALVFPGLVPTPLTAFATLRLGACAAVMVTASHNPPEYNGYKVYWGNGAQIVPPHDQGIAAAIDAVEPANQVRLLPPAEARARGLWRDIPESMGEAYLEAILGLRLHGRGAEALSVVYTAMHGVGGVWMERAMKAAGFSRFHPVAEQQQPDGTFPSVRFPNPEEPGAMDLSIAAAERHKADLVLANDPDADRLAVMARDKDGALRMFTGNEVGVLLGHYLLTQGPKQAKPHVATTIVSSVQLGQIAHELGAAFDEVLTGFKWIANRALEREHSEGTRFVFGYEEALGYTVGSVVRDKDGVSAALVFADLAAWCQSRGVTVVGYLEEIQRRHGLFVGAQRNFTFPGSEGAQTIARIMEGFRREPPKRVGAYAVQTVKDYKTGALRLPPSNVIAFELEGGGRVTLRPSGTEPKIKYYFELKEIPLGAEPLAQARSRAEGRLRTVIDAFVALARERGQPA
ncbi:phospho-sugar mutase [Stigmatella aurantiaca]|uniref:Alpha-D-phosphohexomutase n=1 Tax=Stigmatella aurantiaca (strain DW4/3-1) TaxID=378806 RepID=Q098Q7_STIAD|nr:phospho-sugar mutase [Stigmatella aurantiaca]ADO74135.1 Alpha-D-phosphohexomutase [Stigmatella aurantiaca DW4/3-1]EAU68171.1 phosphoglucomutase/phosphomannomutase, C-terminal domain family [Stigmatella aurantiaca DW4/3-1]